MARHTHPPSRALARLLRARRQELGLSLREIEERAAAEGSPIPFSTLSKIEQGKAEPGLRRLVLLLRLYNLPVELAGELLEVEELAGDDPVQEDPEALFEEGLEAVRRGDHKRGLANLIALRYRTVDSAEHRLLRQKATLTLAITVANLGKTRLARRLAEDLLFEPPHPSLLVNVLTLIGRTWRQLGSHEGALAFLERAEAHVGPDEHGRRAWILHEKALVLQAQGDLDGAMRLIDAALEAYRAAGDHRGEGNGIGAKIKIAEQRGDLRGALELALQGYALAERRGYKHLSLYRTLDRGRILFAMGDREGGLRVLNEGLARAISLGDKDAQFHAHYQLWKAHAALGDEERARFEEGAARYFVRFVDEVSDAAREVRELLLGR
ncbi:MAG: helix-turn-helix domain-containing protein [Acidobacteria bacterium]|nr:MAG: helix-turn-helix domain-containing protein [Acidobacteriota bacterium]